MLHLPRAAGRGRPAAAGLPAARAYADESLAIAREIGCPQGVARSLRCLGSLALVRGEAPAAREQYAGRCVSQVGVAACDTFAEHRQPGAERRRGRLSRGDPELGAPAAVRAKARWLGVSHEAVRQAMIAAGLPTDGASRNRAIREMSARAGPWPEIARAIGMSPGGVRLGLPRPADSAVWSQTGGAK